MADLDEVLIFVKVVQFQSRVGDDYHGSPVAGPESSRPFHSIESQHDLAAGPSALAVDHFVGDACRIQWYLGTDPRLQPAGFK